VAAPWAARSAGQHTAGASATTHLVPFSICTLCYRIVITLTGLTLIEHCRLKDLDAPPPTLYLSHQLRAFLTCALVPPPSLPFLRRALPSRYACPGRTCPPIHRHGRHRFGPENSSVSRSLWTGELRGVNEPFGADPRTCLFVYSPRGGPDLSKSVVFPRAVPYVHFDNHTGWITVPIDSIGRLADSCQLFKRSVRTSQCCLNLGRVR
jgi:hypothetical protein